MFSREGRVRLFLGFLVLVLVVVNSQSLQLSAESRSLLTEGFEQSFESRVRLLAAELSGPRERIEEEARARGFRSACILDWSARLLTGGSCEPPRGEAFDRLDRDGRMRLLESGWATTEITSPYDVQAAEATGYLVMREEGEPEESILRVVVPASAIAEANRRYRATLVYQVSALSLVLVALLLFFHSLVAPHRRLVAEARTVATELSPDTSESRDEGQFLLETFQDVVARWKEKERELQALHLLEKTRADETEALASDIIRSMTTGLVSLDPSGQVVLVNPAAEKLFAVEAAAARGTSFREVFAGSEELERMVEEALEKGAYHLRGQADYRAPGRTLHLGVSVIPLLSREGSPKGALCLFADLTEVVELRERLFLKENLARLGEMAAGIAHEFRNGLATIMGNARLLQTSDASPSPGETNEIAEAVLAEGQSLARVVTDFLQFARPEPLHPERVELAALLRGVLQELAPRAEEAGVALALEGDGVVLEGDEPLLRKAFTNLVGNAIEALAESPRSGAQVAVELSRGSGFAVARVRDNGPGIDPADRDQIFTPFFTRKENGTGLGLSVVQKVVVTHNGTVELERTDEGASFLVRLPLASSPPSELRDWI